MTKTDKVRAALDKIEQHFTVETPNTFGVFEKTHYESNGDPIYRAEITKSELVGLMKETKEALSELDGMVFISLDEYNKLVQNS